MSAVIWFGIVAVWAFVLIPTWVRRSDIHWRRSGDASLARDKLGRAARVISRSGSRRSATTRTTVPAMRHPGTGISAHAAPRTAITRSATITAGAGGGPATAVLDAETETLPVVRIDEPRTQQMPPQQMPPQQMPTQQTAKATDTDTDTDTVTASATSAQVADATEPEAPMDSTRTTRSVPRRATPTSPKTPPPHVQRTRRLVWIGATALATLLLAFVFGSWWILLNLIADAALIGYLRHLRGIAKQQLARKARAQTARVSSRSDESRSHEGRSHEGRSHEGRSHEVRSHKVRERATAPAHPQRRPAAPRHRVESPDARRSTATREPARAAAPATSAGSMPAPEFIDLTDEARPGEARPGETMSDDCPTTELAAARAV
ncbi:MAG TPA: hypothetical protein VLR26_16585 [Frankiaceae bacterium]|nr:hypothetical protein [Frankiaceae bacterium]